ICYQRVHAAEALGRSRKQPLRIRFLRKISTDCQRLARAQFPMKALDARQIAPVCRTTCAPSATNPRAIAEPIPPEAPVTTITLSANLVSMFQIPRFLVASSRPLQSLMSHDSVRQ